MSKNSHPKQSTKKYVQKTVTQNNQPKNDVRKQSSQISKPKWGMKNNQKTVNNNQKLIKTVIQNNGVKETPQKTVTRNNQPKNHVRKQSPKTITLKIKA